jgi:hypothetical protein
MGRMARGSRQRRRVPGVGALVLHRHRHMDRAFCVAGWGDDCWLCANIAALEAGQPVRLIGDDVYGALCEDEQLARACRDLRDDRSVYLVGADTIERLKPAPNRPG